MYFKFCYRTVVLDLCRINRQNFMASLILRAHHFRQLDQLSTCGFIVRQFSLSYVLSTSSREARFLAKIMRRHKPKGKYYQNDFNSVPSTSRFERPINQRRMSVLNKLFMKNITEVLATGSSSYSIEGLGIEISKVSITSDFKVVNIKYFCKTNPRPDGLDELLINVGFSLRHDLSQLKLMGEVPQIQFVEDKTLKTLMLVEELLSSADTGPEDDGNPVSFNEDESFQMEQLEELNMSQRAYGLNHSKILDKIKTLKIASSRHRHKTVGDVTSGLESVNFNAADSNRNLSKENVKQIIKTFLKESKAELKH